MSWLKDLYDTYQVNVSQVGIGDENPLLPVLHKLESTQVVVTLNLNGSFVDAQVSDLRDTMIPCSEASQGRAAGVAAHPLTDGISYVAKNFNNFSSYKKCPKTEGCGNPKCKDCQKRLRQILKFEDYKKQLTLWTEYSQHPHLKSVLRYISNGDLINDLIRTKTLFLDEDQRFANSWVGQKDSTPAIFKVLSKYSQKKQGDISIRWSISDGGMNDLWKSRELHHLWYGFSVKDSKCRELCLISGQKSVLATKSPRDIRKSGDGAKIISANDHDNYTYKGRFEKKKLTQVATLGLEANQAAHAALKWLIKRQGYNSYETFALVAWGLRSTEIIQPVTPEDDLFGDCEEELPPDTKEGVGRVFQEIFRSR